MHKHTIQKNIRKFKAYKHSKEKREKVNYNYKNRKYYY